VHSKFTTKQYVAVHTTKTSFVTIEREKKVTEKKGFQQSCQQSHLEPTVNKTFVLSRMYYIFCFSFLPETGC
jgi:hypothetical protein